jgi:hypothetical protein
VAESSETRTFLTSSPIPGWKPLSAWAFAAIAADPVRRMQVRGQCEGCLCFHVSTVGNGWKDRCRTNPRDSQVVRHLAHPTVKHTASGPPGAEATAIFLGRGGHLLSGGHLLRGGRSLLLPSPAGHTVRIWFSEAGELILYQNWRNRRPETDPAPVSPTSREGLPARPAQAWNNRTSPAAPVTSG